jgi:hypothetical protein
MLDMMSAQILRRTAPLTPCDLPHLPAHDGILSSATFGNATFPTRMLRAAASKATGRIAILRAKKHLIIAPLPALKRLSAMLTGAG